MKILVVKLWQKRSILYHFIHYILWTYRAETRCREAATVRDEKSMVYGIDVVVWWWKSVRRWASLWREASANRNRHWRQRMGVGVYLWAARRILCITHLHFQYTYTGLYGRTILVFDGGSLSRVQSFGPGLLLSIYFTSISFLVISSFRWYCCYLSTRSFSWWTKFVSSWSYISFNNEYNSYNCRRSGWWWTIQW